MIEKYYYTDYELESFISLGDIIMFESKKFKTIEKMPVPDMLYAQGLTRYIFSSCNKNGIYLIYMYALSKKVIKLTYFRNDDFVESKYTLLSDVHTTDNCMNEYKISIKLINARKKIDPNINKFVEDNYYHELDYRFKNLIRRKIDL